MGSGFIPRLTIAHRPYSVVWSFGPESSQIRVLIAVKSARSGECPWKAHTLTELFRSLSGWRGQGLGFTLRLP